MVLKTGIERFDALHAYGLGILLAVLCQQTVTVKDASLHYMLTSEITAIPPVPDDLFDQLFLLPQADEVLACEQKAYAAPLPVLILDGLLAALATHPRIRVFSIIEVLWRRQRSQESDVIDRKLQRVKALLQEWKDNVQHTAHNGDWVTATPADYRVEHAVTPLLKEGTAEKEMHILMAIDPACGYSLRRTYSDAQMTKMTNVSVRGPRYAALLAYIGASRFLRAHRLQEKRIAFYVPLATTLIITPETALQLLFPLDLPATQAIAWRWLSLCTQSWQRTTRWKALAYHVLQNQGMQQACLMERGRCDMDWLARVEAEVGKGVIIQWKSQLSLKGDRYNDERDHLADFLQTRHFAGWLHHLCQQGRIVHQQEQARASTKHMQVPTSAKQGQTHESDKQLPIRPYTIDEIRSITRMIPTPSTPGTPALLDVLTQEEGTIRFGRALRHLGEANPSGLRDLLDLLEAAQTPPELFKVLHRVVQECEVEKGDFPFIIIPTERDLKALLTEVDRYGVPTPVGLLMILSSVRYPRQEQIDKYEIATLIGALLALVAYISRQADDTTESAGPDMFIDDPDDQEGVRYDDGNNAFSDL
jgi:hypothetical protein